jgi:hypothetical protein
VATAEPRRGGRGAPSVGLVLASGAMRLMGIDINTIVIDNVATRCDGCLEIIDGTPWRLNILDIVSTEVPMSAARQGVINPGPFQFHGDAGHVRRWMADNGYWFCRKSEVREIMRPIPVPAPDGTLAWGLCDGIHRDDHEFVRP